MKSSVILVGSIVAAILVIFGAFTFFKPQEEVKLPILIEEYADFNCIHCKEFEPVVEQIKLEFGEKVQYKFVNNPILGNDSLQKAFAVEAAGEQGKFEEYKKKLFEYYGETGEEVLAKIATELSLNLDKFNDDRESELIQNRVNQLLEANRAKGINSTPTIYVNGRVVINRDFDSLKLLINEKIALAEKQASAENLTSNPTN